MPETETLVIDAEALAPSKRLKQAKGSPATREDGSAQRTPGAQATQSAAHILTFTSFIIGNGYYWILIWPHDVARTLVSAAPRLVSALFLGPRQECLRDVNHPNTPSPTAIKPYVSGSGMVGTLDGAAGLSPFPVYCPAVSSTTAPVNGVTT